MLILRLLDFQERPKIKLPHKKWSHRFNIKQLQWKTKANSRRVFQLCFKPRNSDHNLENRQPCWNYSLSNRIHRIISKLWSDSLSRSVCSTLHCVMSTLPTTTLKICISQMIDIDAESPRKLPLIKHMSLNSRAWLISHSIVSQQPRYSVIKSYPEYFVLLVYLLHFQNQKTAVVHQDCSTHHQNVTESSNVRHGLSKLENRSLCLAVHWSHTWNHDTRLCHRRLY